MMKKPWDVEKKTPGLQEQCQSWQQVFVERWEMTTVMNQHLISFVYASGHLHLV